MPPKDPRRQEVGEYTQLLCDRCGKPPEKETQNVCREPGCHGRVTRQRVRVYADPRQKGAL